MRPAARNLSKTASTCLVVGGFMRWGRDVTGELFGGTEILKGSNEQEPKSVEDFEKMSGNSVRTSANWVMTSGVQPGPWKSNVISRRWGGKRSHARRKLVRCSACKRSSRAGEGERSEGGAEGAVVSSHAGTVSSRT